jgi:BclB C-terminal domain-containing protein
VKKNLLIPALFLSLNLMAQVGIGTTTPGTTLDVNGAITNRETQVVISSNAATIPANTSMVQLTGTATAAITITAPAAPNAGQRLIIFNNTAGGFGSVLNSITIPSGQAGEFIYSSGNWRSLSPLPATSASTIIPYASSLPITLTTIAGGLSGTGAMIGFGNSISGIVVSAANIDLTGGSGLNVNFGFTLPRSGTIKSLSAFFSTAAGLTLTATNVAIKAQLYKSNSTTSNLFSPVSGAVVTLTPALTGSLTVGTTCTGMVSGLSIPVTAQSRFILVFSTTATGLSLITSVSGYASAGVSFD